MAVTWEAFVDDALQHGAVGATDANRRRIGRFGDLQAEHAALRDGTGLVDRSYRGLLEVTGSDRVAWLHNLTTNEIRNLSAGEGTYSFSLNRQGRILFDLVVAAREDAIWVDLDRVFLDGALQHFGKYTIIEDVSVADRSADYVRFALVGEGATAILDEWGASHAASMSWFSQTRVRVDDTDVIVMRSDFCGSFAVDLFVPPASAVDLWRCLVERDSNPVTPVGWDATGIRRIEAGIPWPGCEIIDEYVPAETGLYDKAVSRTKGCYLGQEVVERMRSREVVARRLVGLRLEGDAVPRCPATIHDESGVDVGRVTSTCRSVAVDGIIALGFVKSNAANAGTKVSVDADGGAIVATVADLPFA